MLVCGSPLLHCCCATVGGELQLVDKGVGERPVSFVVPSANPMLLQQLQSCGQNATSVTVLLKTIISTAAAQGVLARVSHCSLPRRVAAFAQHFACSLVRLFACFAVKLGHSPLKPHGASKPAVPSSGPGVLPQQYKLESSIRNGQTRSVPIELNEAAFGLRDLVGATRTHMQPDTTHVRDTTIAAPYLVTQGRLWLDTVKNAVVYSVPMTAGRTESMGAGSAMRVDKMSVRHPRVAQCSAAVVTVLIQLSPVSLSLSPFPVCRRPRCLWQA